MRLGRFAFVPVVVAFAAFFSVLPQTGADATVVIDGPRGRWALDPAAVRVDRGDRVAFRNESKSVHTATCVEPGCWDSGDVQPGETVFVAMETEGTFAYVCRYHRDVPGLAGTLTVGDPPAEAEPSASPSPSGSP